MHVRRLDRSCQHSMLLLAYYLAKCFRNESSFSSIEQHCITGHLRTALRLQIGVCANQSAFSPRAAGIAMQPRAVSRCCPVDTESIAHVVEDSRVMFICPVFWK